MWAAFLVEVRRRIIPENLVPPHAQAPRVPERTLPDLDMQDKGDLSSTKAPRANKRKDIRSTNANELNKYVSIYVHVHTYTCIRCTLWSNTFGSSSTEQQADSKQARSPSTAGTVKSTCTASEFDSHLVPPITTLLAPSLTPTPSC